MASYKPDPAIRDLGPEEDGAPFFDAVTPAAFPEQTLRYRNNRWARAIGLDHLTDDQWVAHFAAFDPLPDNLKEPLALRYHGHQFRHYNPDIGDGRGFLFAQMRDDQGRLLDLGTKGSGRTPYSRTADGRLTLKGAVREVLATEMLEALGVYTSKTFSVVETGEALERHDEPSPTRSAVLTRLGHSHIRFGAFQRLGFEGDREAINNLIRYCVRHFDPDLSPLSDAEVPAAFFDRVVARTARLAAQWMAAGFVHGVLNTDNMNVTGESFDYGPWRFLPLMDYTFTAAYFDHQQLYAYGRQPDAAAWNLSRLGGIFAMVSEEAPLNDALKRFGDYFEAAMVTAFFKRLGLQEPDAADRQEAFAFIVAWLEWMQKSQAPFEQCFFDWFGGAASEARAEASPAASYYGTGGNGPFTSVKEKLLAYAPAAPERLDHEYFQQETPCTMLIGEVEALWDQIAEHDDWSGIAKKLAEIETMRLGYGFNASVYKPTA